LFWYERTKKQGVRDGKGKIRMWNKVKKLMEKQFLVGTYREKLHSRVFLESR